MTIAALQMKEGEVTATVYGLVCLIFVRTANKRSATQPRVKAS